MSMAFEQVPLINLAKVTVADIPVAILPLEPEELAARTPVIFQKGFDDLDMLLFCLPQLPSGRDVTLVRHKNCPSPGTEVWIEWQNTSAMTTSQEYLATLKLTLDDLTWINPNCIDGFPLLPPR
jgi:hypothetical protein